MGPSDLPGPPPSPPDPDPPEPSGTSRDAEADRERVAAIRSGDLAAFEALFREYHGRLRAFALTLVDSPDVADDLVEDLFVRLWERRASWTLSGRLESYLYSALRNRALNHLDRRGRVTRIHAEVSAAGRPPGLGRPGLPPDEELERARIRKAVSRAIDELPERSREAFVLHRFSGASQAEIAEIMGVSRRTVENHVARAVRLLREALADLRSDDPAPGGDEAE